MSQSPCKHLETDSFSRQGQPDRRRFVLLWHEVQTDSAIASHWDLMIEIENGLATWRLTSDWMTTPRQTVERIADHRLEYLDFQGPLSNQRGTIRQVYRGEFAVQAWTESQITGLLQFQDQCLALRLNRIKDTSQWMLEVRSTEY